jgi:hypothetical protein
MTPEQLTAIEMTSEASKCRPPGVVKSDTEVAFCLNQVAPPPPRKTFFPGVNVMKFEKHILKNIVDLDC